MLDDFVAGRNRNVRGLYCIRSASEGYGRYVVSVGYLSCSLTAVNLVCPGRRLRSQRYGVVRNVEQAALQSALELVASDQSSDSISEDGGWATIPNGFIGRLHRDRVLVDGQRPRYIGDVVVAVGCTRAVDIIFSCR